ncbi:MAG: hypothetical protein H3C27_13535 [Opitutaceae bacterium]|nr:hypothetical protein [Opitutaceae bacterium]
MPTRPQPSTPPQPGPRSLQSQQSLHAEWEQRIRILFLLGAPDDYNATELAKQRRRAAELEFQAQCDKWRKEAVAIQAQAQAQCQLLLAAVSEFTTALNQLTKLRDERRQQRETPPHARGSFAGPDRE